MTEVQRNNLFDYAKCFLILLVVLDHLSIKSPISPAWIMVGFFFISGYLYKAGRPLNGFIKKRFNRLIIPFWITLAVGAVFELFRANYFGYCDSTIALAPLLNAIWGSNLMPASLAFYASDFITPVTYRENVEWILELGTPSTSALWFLPAMFTGSVMFALYQEKVRRHSWNDAIAVLILLYLAWTETLWGGVQYPWGIGRGFFACACMIVGFNCNKWGVFENKKLFVGVGLIGLVLAVCLNEAGLMKAALLASYYGNFGYVGVLTLLVGGLGMTFFFLLLMRLLQFAIPDSSVLVHFGKSSMPIYRWHIFFLTFFGVAFHEFLGMPIVSDSYFMTLIPAEYLGLKVVACAGTMILCTLFDMLLERVKNRVLRVSTSTE